jgi:uncharacterized hydrophobic protein (TIGR00271 family)
MNRPAVFKLLDLRHDQEDPRLIDREIRDGVRMIGTNLWVLMFAILVACVGLNVNSTAVIIGAMLISPLMGPILGVGYGAGINDSQLIRESLRTLGVFFAISLIASTLYFSLSPLSQAQSELLARTSPSLWDVLVAFFGGCAGVVAATRKETSNVLPGVAIATALMPPLCTVGYGVAQGDWSFALGAFLLFVINCVFIALSTLMFVKILRLPQHAFADEGARLRTRLVIGAAVAATLLPSAYLTWKLVKDQLFLTGAQRIVAGVSADPDVLLLAQEIDPAQRHITLTVGGATRPKDLEHRVQSRLAAAGLPLAQVQVRYAGAEPLDPHALKQELERDVYQNTLSELQRQTGRVEALERQLAQDHATREDRLELIREIQAQYPQALAVSVLQGPRAVQGAASATDTTVALLQAPAEGLPADEVQRLRNWLQVHFGGSAGAGDRSARRGIGRVRAQRAVREPRRATWPAARGTQEMR